MTEFESSIGKTVVDGEPRKVYTVGDEDEGLGSLEDLQSMRDGNVGQAQFTEQPVMKKLSTEETKEFFKRRQEILDEEKRVNPVLKKKIEILAGIGRAIDEVEIGDFTFSIRTPKGRESKALVKLAALYGSRPAVDFVFDMREQTLARAIYAVNGVKLEDFIGSDNIADKVDFINELGDPAVAYLHQRYEKMAEEVREKYSVKDEAEAKEVAEAVKKS